MVVKFNKISRVVRKATVVNKASINPGRVRGRIEQSGRKEQKGREASPGKERQIGPPNMKTLKEKHYRSKDFKEVHSCFL